MARATRLSTLALAVFSVLALAAIAQAAAVSVPPTPSASAAGGRIGTILIHFDTDGAGPAPPPAYVAPPPARAPPVSPLLVEPAPGATPSPSIARRYEIDAFGMFVAIDTRSPAAAVAPAEALEGARAIADAPVTAALPANGAPREPAAYAGRVTTGGRVVRTAEPAPHAAAPGSELPAIPATPLAAGAGAAVLFGFALRLYHRVTSGPDREKGLRSTILARLRDGGPARERDLAGALAVDRTTARYHARLLVKSGLVVERRLGRIPWFALAGDPRLRDLNEAAVALQHPLARALFEAARAHERAKLGELAALASTSPQNANYHLGRLVAVGALVSEKAPDGARYHVPAVAALPRADPA